MSHHNWKQLYRVTALASIALFASSAWAQADDAANLPRVSPNARNVIMNDSRTTASADAASAAMDRGVATPDLAVKSPKVEHLASEAAAAASCELANLEFEVGSAELTQSALSELAVVAKCLQNQPSMSMWVVGHADNQGLDSRNWVLAMERALAVKDALRSLGVNPEQLLAVSAGATGERAVSLELTKVNPRSVLVPG